MKSIQGGFYWFFIEMTLFIKKKYWILNIYLFFTSSLRLG
jgi:hypothetical protein